MKKTNKKGFTLVELVIVIAVIAILAAVLLPTFSGIIEKANASKALQEARNAYTNAMIEVLDNGVIDSTEQAGHLVDGYTFKWNASGVLTEVTNATCGYTFEVTNGAITKAVKATPTT